MCRGPRKKAQPWSVCVRACVDQQCGVGVRVDLDFPPSGPFHQEVECVFRLLSFTNRRWQRRRPVSAEAGLGQATASPPASPGAQPPALGKPEERHGQAPGRKRRPRRTPRPAGQPSTRPLSTSRRPSAPPDTTGSRGNAQSPRRITGIDRSFSATAFWGALLHDQRWPTHTSEGMIPPVCACGQETGADTGRSTHGGQ